jgi:hypothetical protein
MGAGDHMERIARFDAIWDAIRRGEPSAVSDDIYSQSPICDP